jgi:hypothetical protein
MSYDFQLIINTAGKADEVMDWLKDYSGLGSPQSYLMDNLITFALNTHNTDVIMFTGSDWEIKYWYEMIYDLDEEFEQDSEVEIAFAVIGVDYDDITVRSTDNITPYVSRYIDVPIIDCVPSSKSCDKLEASNNDIKIGKPIEEMCPVCQRMKDVGSSCWWCGHDLTKTDEGYDCFDDDEWY